MNKINLYLFYQYRSQHVPSFITIYIFFLLLTITLYCDPFSQIWFHAWRRFVDIKKYNKDISISFHSFVVDINLQLNHKNADLHFQKTANRKLLFCLTYEILSNQLVCNYQIIDAIFLSITLLYDYHICLHWRGCRLMQ